MTVVKQTEYQRPVDRGWAWVVMCGKFVTNQWWKLKKEPMITHIFEHFNWSNQSATIRISTKRSILDCSISPLQRYKNKMLHFCSSIWKIHLITCISNVLGFYFEWFVLFDFFLGWGVWFGQFFSVFNIWFDSMIYQCCKCR